MHSLELKVNACFSHTLESSKNLTVKIKIVEKDVGETRDDCLKRMKSINMSAIFMVCSVIGEYII